MANVSSDNKKTSRNATVSSPLRSENYLILSTSYPLNNSDTKRLHVGLRAVNENGPFEVTIKLTGNSSAGIYFDWDTWLKFQENVEHANDYLCGKKILDPIFINNIVINFTSAYGVRAIMLSKRQEVASEGSTTSASNETEAPPPKKRKTHSPSIVMQKTSFDGIENIIKCINVRYNELNSSLSLVNDCTRFLITEIELNLPRGSLDEDVVKQTLADNYQKIRQTVRCQIKDLVFLDNYFEILFEELTALHRHEITRAIVISKTS